MTPRLLWVIRPTTISGMKLRTLIVSVAIAAGAVSGLAAQADASTPRVGAACSASEIGKIRYTGAGQKVRCTSTGATGVKWVRVAR
ncbi:hypothetical protein GOARA_054_00020 [Gordonia araii NBRC 100433]|uniref:SH3b domain-containing protein n=2 Tax=Gordonia araii TaxID=263909 RepID=G7H301_9ACTN|nr:hypothetical protein [Gordonia araii NBRC 100433]GAB10226.1 hypothetical protein GOARA_054_00020 [Gordonia araii NBRC 100433]